MHVQQIERKVFGSQLQSKIKISLPTSERLSGQSSDQIEVDVFESGCAQALKRRRNIRGGMRAAKLFQLAIVKRLCAKTGAINSEPAKLTQFLIGQFIGT